MASAIINEPVPTSNPVPFAFESHQIRTVINGDGKPWFVAKDVARSLGLAWHGKILAPIPVEWVSMRKLLTDRRGVRDTTVISEPAVYKLAFRSNKPEADRFTNWIASEVIPALRRQGRYEICLTTGTLTVSQQQEIKELVQAKASAFPDNLRGKVLSQIWTRVQRKFKIPRYAELPVSLFGEARDYVIAMQIRGAGPETLPETTPTPALPPAVPDTIPAKLELKLRRMRSLKQEMMDISAEVYHVAKRSIRPKFTEFGRPAFSLLVNMNETAEDVLYALDRNLDALEHLCLSGVLAAKVFAGSVEKAGR